MKTRILFTVDVEDYYMSPESIPVSDWGKQKFPDRLHVGMNRLFDLMREFEVEATFFWLGWLAERHPDLVRRCVSEGHEVATHTYDHRPVDSLSVVAFRESLQRSCGILSELSGEAVVSHRAPMWSLRRDNQWMWEELVRAGIKVDSSIYPLKSYLFGDPTSSRHPYWMETSEGRILEVPPGTVDWFGVRAPVGGGGYLRALPWPYIKMSLNKWFSERKKPVNLLGRNSEYGGEPVLYIHPWELDPDHPELPIRGRERRVHWRGIRSTLPKLRKLFMQSKSLSFRRAFGLI